MKRIFACISLFFVAAALLTAQHGPVLSPPASASATLAGKVVRIDYSSPRVKGRAGKLFGKDGRIGQDPQYPIWRAGANSATALHTETDLDIGGLTVPKGDYTLFVDLSDPAHWVLVVSKQTGEWGLSFDKTQELGRAKMATSAAPALVEDLTYTLTSNGSKGAITLAWENVSATVAIAAK
jgi:hypothetical protein